MHIGFVVYVLLAFWYGLSTITLLRQGWDAPHHSRRRAASRASSPRVVRGY